jgi:LPS-assembly lipoprotein
MIRAIKWVLLSGLLSALLSGCGFHLRGAEDSALPAGMQKVAVTGVGVTDTMGVELRQSLRANGAEVLQDKEPGSAILRILKYRTKRRVLSVSPVTGKVRELEIHLLVDFDVIGAAGDKMIQQQSVELVRNYIFDETQVYGTSQQEATLIDDLRRDAVQQIMHRISSQAGSTVSR